MAPHEWARGSSYFNEGGFGPLRHDEQEVFVVVGSSAATMTKRHGCGGPTAAAARSSTNHKRSNRATPPAVARDESRDKMDQDAAMSGNYGYALDPGFKSLLASLGVRHEDVLRRAGLAEDLLSRPNVRVPAEQFLAFAHAIQASVDDPLFPIHLTRNLSAESFSPPLFAALCSPDLSVALTRLATFKPLIAPIRMRVQSSPHGLRATLEWLECVVEPPPFLVGAEALFLVKLARMGTRHDVRAQDVTLPELPSQHEAFEAFLGCRIRRDDLLSVSFAAEDAQRPFVTDNSTMWDIFEPQLRKRLSDLEDSASFEARTRSVLTEVLPSGQVSIDVVAQRLAVSARTLQRRLRDEGTSFTAVVRETRKRLALYYLGQTQLAHHEIAYLLGFEEPNSFFRAFHSWTGMTPESHRQAHNPVV